MGRPALAVLLAPLCATVAAGAAPTRVVRKPRCVWKKAKIPAACHAVVTLDLRRRPVCPKPGSGFSVCAALTRRTDCAATCFTKLLARALEQRKCGSRPMLWALFVMRGKCVETCEAAKAGLGVKRACFARALLAVQFRKFTVSAKFRKYLPWKRFQDGRFTPDKHADLCKLFPGAHCAVQNAQACWYCHWMGWSCPGCGYGEERWNFEW